LAGAALRTLSQFIANVLDDFLRDQAKRSTPPQ
jgi:hypothetical protein